MEHKLQQRDKNRPSYFGNVKTRLGSKLPPGVAQPPGFIAGPWETGPQTGPTKEARDSGQSHRAVGRPFDHVRHIRNPQLRQYYLQEATWVPEGATAKSREEGQPSDDKADYMAHHEDTVFSVTSQYSSMGDQTKLNRHISTSSSLISRQHLRVPKSKGSGQGSSPVATHPDPDLRLEPELDTDPGLSPAPSPSPHSLSPDAEYDKLLDVEAVQMPDGQLCLLALLPECSVGEGSAAMPYLKLFCRYITDRKGVVSGILLVTSNKMFFDPCKTHPLVIEHGCEEYLLSCSVDSLASVSFYSDISHVHFNSSTHRWKGTKNIQKTGSKTVKMLEQGGRRSSSSPPHHKGETVPALVSAATSELRSDLALSLVQGFSEEERSSDMAEWQLEGKGSPLEELVVQSSRTVEGAVLSSAATFCCGGQEAAGTGNKVRMELVGREGMKKQQSVRNQTPGPSRLSSGTSGGLMFVRLRLQQSTGKKKGVAAGLLLGTNKTLPRRDSWFAFSQESSDELYAYMNHWKPGLCMREGGSGEGDEEEFVLVEDREEEEEKEEEQEVSKDHGRTGEDWELVTVEDGRERLPLDMDKDPEGLCEIVAQSRILDASLVRELSVELPPRTVGHTWQLAYSTSRHGSSLKSLYRRLKGSDSPVLMVIKDSLNQVFGSFLSHPLRPSETFYGTGETFLFMLLPRFKCFKWTGENSFFIKGDLDSFAIGGGSGHFGLWLDEMLYLGRSSPCYTFNNCCLSERDDFHVMELEVWTFW
ncbi:nuclear receptor coactivator 7 isoform X1 [Salmo salar]|uniref:Nuclear receptor coactivator 7-like isoform X1 n=1 Tax=Salmo salar TaxID=8030 RepID=A0A1S3L043_SALSA|nr:nuclear receptor coactivator 7 isoform X1 [Salmo salar]XP_013984273.1 nuclear receptor coactivator 7 isoform X1 [Salmo salar]|eukprot:XP_013984190.1 PREDICTED: nuclear receptor coactivator 7-like isoform X1 [Salmo salar]